MGRCDMLQCLVVLALASISSALVIKTNFGSIEGKRVTTKGRNDVPAYAFLGIPYAAPPVGELRFKPPQPPTPWKGTLIATQYGSMCPSKEGDAIAFASVYNLPTLPFASLKMSEDCLFLNIFAPEPNKKAEPVAVLVFIHGGGFTFGSSTYTDGYVYATRHGVILVTINYRLGLLGFMTMVNEYLPANNGLLDQIAALQWVHDNIAAFGGDPQKVTIFGESAGAMSVNFHVFSPSSVASSGEALFQRAIYQSGSLAHSRKLAPSASVARWAASKVAKHLGCLDRNSSMEVVSCLRNVSVTALVYTLPHAMLQAVSLAVVDGTHIPDDPARMMHAGNFTRNIDVILGVCNTEGYMFTPSLVPRTQWENFKKKDFAFYARKWLESVGNNQWSEKTLNKLEKKVLKIYQADTRGDTLRRHFVDFNGDLRIAYPTLMAALAHKDYSQGETYFYEFNYRISTSISPYYITADHTDNLLFTFGFSSNNDSFFDIGAKYNTYDKQMDAVIPTYWSNFAKTGNPNEPEKMDGLTEWKVFTGDRSPFLKLQLPPMMSQNYNMERVHFWTSTIGWLVSGSTPAASATMILLLSMVLFALLIKE